jgi:RIO kinase 1
LQIYIIDVSQSVEHDHPNALEFLRKDCKNVIDFFARNGAQTLSLRDHFQAVSDPNLSRDDVWHAYFEQKLAESALNQDTDMFRRVRL